MADPLTPLESDTISKGIQITDKIMAIYAEIVELQVIYDSGGGVKETTAGKTAEIEKTFKGLTKQQLDDGMYALTSGLKTVLDNSKAQMIQLSARA